MTRVNEMAGGGEIKPAAASGGGEDDATLHGIAGVVRGVLAAECGRRAGDSQAVVLRIRNRGQLRARHQAMDRRRERRSERRGEDRGLSEWRAWQGAPHTAATSARRRRRHRLRQSEPWARPLSGRSGVRTARPGAKLERGREALRRVAESQSPARLFRLLRRRRLHEPSIHGLRPPPDQIACRPQRHEGPYQRRGDRPNRQGAWRSEEHTSELQSQSNLVCRLLLEKKKKNKIDSFLTKKKKKKRRKK